jgi:hypothetical protein
MDLKLKEKDVQIESIALPMNFQISLQKRGKAVVNHRYVEDIKELQIYCSSCNRWHPVFKLENGEWVDINKTYKLCNAGKEREYFDTYCSQCYLRKTSRGDAKQVEKEAEEETVGVNGGKDTKLGEEGEYLPWSQKSGGIQQTISLSPILDKYLKLYGVYHNKKKNQLINEIIAEFKTKNPINL